MRRIFTAAAVVTAALAMVTAALAMAAPASAAPPAEVALNLSPGNAHHVQTFPSAPGTWTPGRTLGYWGTFTGQGVQPGSYRATCSWLANRWWAHSTKHKQDKRLSCTIIIAFASPPAPPGTPLQEPNSVVLQGLVRRPVGDGQLFAIGSSRQLAITGGSGAYSGVRGYASIKLAWKIIFPNGLSPT